MKIGNKVGSSRDYTRPERNSGFRTILVVVLAIMAVCTIFWVYNMGQKAEETVEVAMINGNMYKQQVVSEESLVKYDMAISEYERYTLEKSKKRRVVLWEDRKELIGAFAAYPLQNATVAMYDSFVKSRTDNSDTVLYSFPGKNIVTLNIGADDLKSFKTFLQPGDRINVTAIFSSKEKVYTVDENGTRTASTVDTFREEVVFTDIMVADLLNSSGASILDLYASYNERTVYEQAKLDTSESWLESVEPSVMLAALTPEEETRYYQYLSKSDVEFHIALPQRTN
jgi:hypothetical protein